MLLCLRLISLSTIFQSYQDVPKLYIHSSDNALIESVVGRTQYPGKYAKGPGFKLTRHRSQIINLQVAQ